MKLTPLYMKSRLVMLLNAGLFFTVLGTSVISCGGNDNQRTDTLVDSRDAYDPRSLDPALSTDVPTGRAVTYIFDGLTRFTEEAEVLPNLAESWEISADGLTYTFKLKTGVLFHDGTPFTARSVETSFERVLDPKTLGGRGWPLYPVRGAKEFANGKSDRIAGLKIMNDSILQLTLVEPFAIFPKMLAMPATFITPVHASGDSLNFGEHPIGTGPWKFVEWRHDDYIKFARNDRYHGDIPLVDTLIARIIPEQSSAVAEFESGRVDIVPIPAQETRSWEARTDAATLLQSSPSLRLMYAAINTTRGPLKDARVRRAINHAIDIDMLLNRLMGGRGARANGVIPSTLTGYNSKRPVYKYDTTLAKRLLNEAGYPNGVDIELWCSQGEPMPRMAQTIQAYLALVNIRVKIVQRDASSMREAARNGATDIALKDWFADYPDAEAFLYPLLHSSNFGVGGNVSFYSNSQVDSLINSARRQQDEAKRAELYEVADSISFYDAPMIYLFFYKEVFAVQPWLKGYKVPSIFNGQRWNTVGISR